MVQKSGKITSLGKGSLSHYLQGFSTIPGGCLGFLPSRVWVPSILSNESIADSFSSPNPRHFGAQKPLQGFRSAVVGLFASCFRWLFGCWGTHRIHGIGIFTYIYHKNQPNVGKYTIHGSYGEWGQQFSWKITWGFHRDPGKTHDGNDNERVSRWGSWFDEVSDDSTRDVHRISSIYLFRFCR